MYVQLDNEDNVIAIFSNPQPDAIDAEGNIVQGVPTSFVEDDDPRVLQFKN